jgi:hypothetical protein
MAQYDNGKEEMQNEFIPIVLERGTEFPRLSDVSEISFVCGAIILASPLAFWLEGIELLGQRKRTVNLERRKREEVGCWLRGAWITEGLIFNPLRGGK